MMQFEKKKLFITSKCWTNIQVSPNKIPYWLLGCSIYWKFSSNHPHVLQIRPCSASPIAHCRIINSNNLRYNKPTTCFLIKWDSVTQHRIRCFFILSPEWQLGKHVKAFEEDNSYLFAFLDGMQGCFRTIRSVCLSIFYFNRY